MNLSLYMSSLRNTAENLPGVLADWEALDDSLRFHYADELVRQFVELDQARDLARRALRLDVLEELAQLTSRLMAMGEWLEDVMHISVADLVAMPGTSLARSAPEEQSQDLALAA
ncbi:MAG: hypothetical protein ACOZQL_13040 [Myxococcota bacterium]